MGQLTSSTVSLHLMSSSQQTLKVTEGMVSRTQEW